MQFNLSDLKHARKALTRDRDRWADCLIRNQARMETLEDACERERDLSVAIEAIDIVIQAMEAT